MVTDHFPLPPRPFRRTMPNSADFWKFFNEISSKLVLRERTFRAMFNYLDRMSHPVTIVETGCTRKGGDWEGDGQSTVLFDKYVSLRDKESVVYSVDIDPASVAEAKRLVSDRVQLTQEDGVRFLAQLTARLSQEGKTIDLLYLDSFDVDWEYWQKSAAHHIKELCAAIRGLRKDTLVVVDDSPLDGLFVTGANQQIQFTRHPLVGGKGRFVAEFAAMAGAKLEFASYQAGWTGF